MQEFVQNYGMNNETEKDRILWHKIPHTECCPINSHLQTSSFHSTGQGNPGPLYALQRVPHEPPFVEHKGRTVSGNEGLDWWFLTLGSQLLLAGEPT